MENEPEVLQQRSMAWRLRRVGVVTASNYWKIMTPPRAKADKESGVWSETATTHMLEKLGELVTGIPADTFQSDATRWGIEHEEEARERAIPIIAERFGASVERPVGKYAFIMHPTEANIGCSPDGIIGDDGLLELKCPWNPVNHLRTVRAGEMPEKHVEQVQGSLWIAERKWYVFASYDPRVEKSGMDPLFMLKVERDENYIEWVLSPRVIQFRDWLDNEYTLMTGTREPF